MLPPRGWSVLFLLCLSLAAAADLAYQEADNANTDGSSTVLPGQFWDCYGDPLPPGAVARLGTVRFRDGEGFEQAAFSADGRVLASVNPRGVVKLWDMATGLEQSQIVLTATYPGTGNLEYFPGYTRIQFNPDGRDLITGDRMGGVRRWDLESGEELWRWLPPNRPDTLAPLMPYFTVFLQTPDFAEGLYLRDFRFDMASDGRTLAVVERGDDRTVRLLDAHTGQERGSLTENRHAQHCRFAPDGRRLVSGHMDCTLRMWDIESGEELTRWHAHGDGVVPSSLWDVVFALEGRVLASVDSGEALRLWDATTGVPNPLFQGALTGSSYLVALPGGREIATVDDQYEFHILDVTTGRPRLSFPCLYHKAVLSPNGRVLALVGNYDISFRDLAMGRPLHDRPVPSDPVCFSPDGRTVASAGDPVRLWDAASGRELLQLAKLQKLSIPCAFTADGKGLLVARGDSRVWLCDPATGRLLRPVTGKPAKNVDLVSAGADGKTVITRSEPLAEHSSFQLWDSTTGKERSRFDLPGGPEGRWYWSPETVSPDGRLLAAAKRTRNRERLENGEHLGERLFVWDLASGRSRGNFGGLDVNHGGHDDLLVLGRIEAMAFTADGKRLLTADQDGRFRLWEVVTKQPCTVFPAESGELSDVICVALSSDGRLLASGHWDKGVRLWDLLTGEELHTFVGHTGPIQSLAFSPDGRRLASQATDASALIWDVTPSAKGPPKAAAPLSPKELELLWEALTNADAARAYWAIGVLAADAPRSVAFLENRLIETHTAPRPPSEAQIAGWIADLDHPRFAVRQHATRQLEAQGDRVETALRLASKSQISLEARCRVDDLLAKLDAAELTPQQLRVERAVAVLERLGTADARLSLSRLTDSSLDRHIRTQAQAAIDRLRMRPVPGR